MTQSSDTSASKAPLAEIAAAIRRCESFVIVSHVGPDGDAIGSGLALRQTLEGLGKSVWMISHDEVPVSSRYLSCWTKVLNKAPARAAKAQCTFIVDCDGKPNRVAAPHDLIEKSPFRILIDHHRTSEPIFDINWIDSSQPATALMMFELLRYLETPMTPEIAECLLCGLSTDTGHYRFANTTPATLRAAAALMELGADNAQAAFKLFEERGFASTKLLGTALQKMQPACEGVLMWTALTADDFTAAGVGDEGSENVVNFLRNVRGARFAVIMRERKDETGPVTRVSVRSELEMRADLFSAQFGGGGHAAAAGFRVRHKPFVESVDLVVVAASKWIEEKLYLQNPPDAGEGAAP